MTERWSFWIDVGGTFTDALAKLPDGEVRRLKLLSSGVTKGRIQSILGDDQVTDSSLCDAPTDFWRGYEFRLLGDRGQVVATARVADFDHRSGMLGFDQPLKEAARPGDAYELASTEEAPILAIRRFLGLPLSQPIPPVAVRLGTTRGTNALLTRSGARTALITTRGFADVLDIGYQNRRDLFELNIQKPPRLYRQVVEMDERVASTGDILASLDLDAARQALARLRDSEPAFESLAICLLNSYQNDLHERQLESLARELGFQEISRSSSVASLVKIVSRGDTTVVDAYLNPILRSYVEGLHRSLGDSSDLRLLTSAGGLVSATQFLGKDSILSGPAGGVVGFARVAQAAGFDRAIGFDMGGTSTDVSRFDGEFELEYETEKAGVRVVSPMMAIETVAAGGGSICRFDGVKLTVGPESTGADPGPACYGRGGPLAVTDINLFLGKILSEQFPFPLYHEQVEQRLADLADEVEQATGTEMSPTELAMGFLRVANTNMAKAIRSISIAKGYDPRDYVLVAFGGAAPQHACAVADELGVESILLHPDAGILSAYGIGMAEVVRHRVQGVYRCYQEDAISELAATFEQMSDSAVQQVIDEGVSRELIEVTQSLDLRYEGLDACLTISQPNDGASFRDKYEAEHQRLYGYRHDSRPIEIVAARVAAVGRAETVPPTSRRAAATTRATPVADTPIVFESGVTKTSVYDRALLNCGDRVVGPAIITEQVSTIIVDPGWQAEQLSEGELLLSRVGRGKEQTDVVSTTADPIMLEVFNNQFAGIAEQMGITLRNTSCSVNVKERLDFSCALFTATGDLVVNAPHIPVHLGAMGETVKCVIADNPTIRPGDVFVTNDPYRGGSHLPDVTVVTPVFDVSGKSLRFFTASRAHHAEIGGITPGSMPPFSKSLAEEGVLIRNFKLVNAGRSRVAELEELLSTAEFPSRSVSENLADIAAQVAANEQGMRDLNRMIDRYTWPVVNAYMRHIQQAAEQKMRHALRQVPDGCHEFVDYLDDGSPICVSITVAGDNATIDFAGTGPVLGGNLNANRAIVTAAVMYCMRCLIDEDIPLNQGVLAPVEIRLPTCLLNPMAGIDAASSPAVVGGNVETSQRVVDVLLGALGLAAASQGTMNNLLFGDDTFGYYETICGGVGATPEAGGANAVHTHMTNTRLTDPEVMEQRFPVRVLQFTVRQGSGGTGKFCGGDGVIRELEFQHPLHLSILSQRRGTHPPYGLAGGQPGTLGKNVIIRAADGIAEVLPGQADFDVATGDRLRIETPGGGGYGECGGIND